VVEIGGALSGFQFALSRAGAQVVNVDPFVKYGGASPWSDPERRLELLNRDFGTTVELRRCTLAEAAIPDASVDTVYCISTLEHLSDQAAKSTVEHCRRILVPGGRLVLTLDLFLDLRPFSSRVSNRYGRNLLVSEVLSWLQGDMITGHGSLLYGHHEFDRDEVQSRLSEWMLGDYPVVAQALVARVRG
jgi:SAM-dependent methyltransferase